MNMEPPAAEPSATATTPPPPAERRRVHWGTPVGIGLSIIAIVIGLIVLAWAVLFVTKGRFLKHRFENIASSLSERQVKVAGDFQLYLDPLNVKFVADGLSVSNPSWASKPNFFGGRPYRHADLDLPPDLRRQACALAEPEQRRDRCRVGQGAPAQHMDLRRSQQEGRALRDAD